MQTASRTGFEKRSVFQTKVAMNVHRVWKIFVNLCIYASTDLSFRLKRKPLQNFAVKRAHFG